MEWRDDGIILSARRHGETSAIVYMLTREHGVHAGLVRGGYARRKRATVEPGNRVQTVWRARLAEHLGAFTLEVVHAHAAGLMENADRLAAMTAALAMTQFAFPEREPHLATFEALCALLEALEHAELALDATAWGSVYVKWELGILSALGFRLDLSHCAATGETGNLRWVSPKSGRAVSEAAGAPYAHKLLVLPNFLKTANGAALDVPEVLQGLKLTGYFLERHLFTPHDRFMPQARARLLERLKFDLMEEGTQV